MDDIEELPVKAIVQRRYGAPGRVLEMADVAKPAIRDDEVLLRVQAASIHPDVWHVVTGRPLVLRLMGAGLFRPRVRIPGTDASGTVEAVGAAVTRLRPGDEVFGEIVRGIQWKNGGAFAEYAAVPEDKLEVKPPNVSHIEAAAVPTSGLIALQGIRVDGRVQDGDRVLVNGAGGAVGSLAVQLAKAYGAEVTAVDSSAKQAMLRTIGSDHVVDYTTADFTQSGERYNLVFDVPGNHSFEDLKRALSEDGRYVLIGHDRFGTKGGRVFGGTIGRMMKLEMFAPFGRNDVRQRPEKPVNPLATLRDLLAAGELVPAIDRTYPLESVVDAIQHLVDERTLGKVVLTI